MLILAFDLATLSGWAAGTTRGVECFGTIELPRTGDDFGRFLGAAIDAFQAKIVEVGPAEVFYEQTIVPGRAKINMKTLRKLYVLGPALELAASRVSVPVWEAQLGDIRTHFLGHGHVPRGTEKIKIAVKNQCRRRGWKIADDNEADALALLDYALGCHDFQFAVQAVPLFSGVAR